jgi:serine/threonine protein kinase
MIELIGRGGYGTVFKGLHREKGNFVAIKKIHLSKMIYDHNIDSLMVTIF